MTEPLVSTSRLRTLRSALGVADTPLLIAIHDYPDPDAIGAALAMQTLVGSWGISSTIAHGGVIGREENSEMVRLLRIDLATFDSIPNLSDYRGAIMLDTQPLARNHSLPADIQVLGVVDHHIVSDDSVRLTGKSSSGTTRIVYSDIRSDVGSTSTLAYGYLETAGIVPDARLATALFLGIKTDTDSLLRDANPADIAAYSGLLPLSDLGIAAEAVHPPLNRDYFQFLHATMERSVLYGKTLVSNCGDVKSPDMLSTASDIFVSIKGVKYALAVGFYGKRAYLSLRAKPSRSDATRVLLKVVEPEGKGGGHNLTAGGFLELDKKPEECLAIIKSRFLEATGEDGTTGVDLI